MSYKRLLAILAAVALLAIGAGVFQMTGKGLSDYFQRHPEAKITIPAGASDWFERHPEVLKAANLDRSDYFQRHPEVLRSGNGLNTSGFDLQRVQQDIAREQGSNDSLLPVIEPRVPVKARHGGENRPR